MQSSFLSCSTSCQDSISNSTFWNTFYVCYLCMHNDLHPISAPHHRVQNMSKCAFFLQKTKIWDCLIYLCKWCNASFLYIPNIHQISLTSHSSTPVFLRASIAKHMCWTLVQLAHLLCKFDGRDKQLQWQKTWCFISNLIFGMSGINERVLDQCHSTQLTCLRTLIK